MSYRQLLSLLKDTFFSWQGDKVSRMAAALAYYSVFSLAPLLIIVVAVAGAIFGRAAAAGEIVGQIQNLVGSDVASVIQGLIENASRPRSGIIATVIGIVTVLIGATGLFSELKDDLNIIWKAESTKGPVGSVLHSRFLSFLMVLGIGLLLLLFIVTNALLAAVASFLKGIVPGLSFFLFLTNVLLPFVLISILFAVSYKFLPDTYVAWGDVWAGSAIASLLFTVGKLVLGLYLGSSKMGSVYGAASSMVVLLFWVYFSAQVFLFGAEFTCVYASRTRSSLPRRAESSLNTQ
jgi:membrane protein